MKATLSLCMMILAGGVLLSGCNFFADPLAAEKNMLVGKWTCYDGPIKTTYEFDADGACTKIVSVAAYGVFGPETSHGTWRLADESTVELCYSNEIAAPTESHHIQLAGSQLVLTDNNRPMTFNRAN